jgi:Type IV secretory system Conjugative DNA transfer
MKIGQLNLSCLEITKQARQKHGIGFENRFHVAPSLCSDRAQLYSKLRLRLGQTTRRAAMAFIARRQPDEIDGPFPLAARSSPRRRDLAHREIYELTIGWRGTEGKNRILRFEPASSTHSVAFNPLDEIRLGTDHDPETVGPIFFGNLLSIVDHVESLSQRLTRDPDDAVERPA